MKIDAQQTSAPKLVSPAKLADHEKFPPLGQVTTPTVTTEAAAHYLNRRPQTLRGWACAETFPTGLRPTRINGRLAWPVSELRRVLGVQKMETICKQPEGLGQILFDAETRRLFLINEYEDLCAWAYIGPEGLRKLACDLQQLANQLSDGEGEQ